MGLLTDVLLDDDSEVARVQRVAAAGARTGASVGSRAGPAGAGIGAGVGGATGYLLGVGLTGVDPADRHPDDEREAAAEDGDATDGPIVISVDSEREAPDR